MFSMDHVWIDAPGRLLRHGTRDDADVEVCVESLGEPFQHRESRYGTAGLEPRHGRLRHARGAGKLGLTPGAPPAQFPYRPAQLERQHCRLVRIPRTQLTPPPFPQLRPACPLSHRRRPLILAHRVRLGQAASQRAPRAGHLGGLPHPRLGERRQQHYPPARCDPVGDPDRSALQMEPQLAQFAVKLPRVRLTQQWTLLGEQVYVEGSRRKLCGRQQFQPVPHFRFQLDGTPRS
ncbi:hypothetical protein FRAHR75_320054 [Frankia sp. Hr75.2]|nr:hypothetical protein FRAHR75_320054 [Frankia sp. Hr75.2]